MAMSMTQSGAAPRCTWQATPHSSVRQGRRRSTQAATALCLALQAAPRRTHSTLPGMRMTRPAQALVVVPCNSLAVVVVGWQQRQGARGCLSAWW